MCNLYSITTNQAAIIALFREVNRYVGNLAPMTGVFPRLSGPGDPQRRPMLQAVRKVLPGRRPHVLDRSSRAGTLFSCWVLVADGAQLALRGRS